MSSKGHRGRLGPSSDPDEDVRTIMEMDERIEQLESALEWIADGRNTIPEEPPTGIEEIHHLWITLIVCIEWANKALEGKTTEDTVDRAMRLLLNRKQIEYVKSQTYRGPSRIQMVRKLLNIGIKAEKIESAQLKAFVKEWRENNEKKN